MKKRRNNFFFDAAKRWIIDSSVISTHFFVAAFILMVLLYSSSCTDRTEAESVLPSSKSLNKVSVKHENGRLVFADRYALHDLLANISHKSAKEKQRWESSLGFYSLKSKLSESSNDLLEEYDNLPDFYLNVLNPQAEYQIGDTIVWYHQGKMHFIFDKNERLLAQIKAKPSINPYSYAITRSLLSSSEAANRANAYKLSFV